VEVIEKWLRKRTGAPVAPLQGNKQCTTCGKTDEEVKNMKQCSRCRLVYYCSAECQSELLRFILLFTLDALT
jgi:hypothetical protein